MAWEKGTKEHLEFLIHYIQGLFRDHTNTFKNFSLIFFRLKKHVIEHSVYRIIHCVLLGCSDFHQV